MKDKLTPEEVIEWIRSLDPKPSPALERCEHDKGRYWRGKTETLESEYSVDKEGSANCPFCTKPKPERVWPCDHIEKKPTGWWSFFRNDFLIDRIKFCEACGAKRPAEKPRTLTAWDKAKKVINDYSDFIPLGFPEALKRVLEEG